MFETKIKNNIVYIDGIPSNEWGTEQWNKWKSNTAELLQQVDRISSKLAVIAKNWKYT